MFRASKYAINEYAYPRIRHLLKFPSFPHHPSRHRFFLPKTRKWPDGLTKSPARAASRVNVGISRYEGLAHQGAFDANKCHVFSAMNSTRVAPIAVSRCVLVCIRERPSGPAHVMAAARPQQRQQQAWDPRRLRNHLHRKPPSARPLVERCRWLITVMVLRTTAIHLPFRYQNPPTSQPTIW